MPPPYSPGLYDILAAMGQDGSKPEEASAHEKANFDPGTTMQGSTTRVNGDAGQANASPMTAVKDPRVSSSQGRLPLKRSLDERERDEDRRRRRNISPSQTRAASSDHCVRKSVSPSGVRHAFVPERTGRRSPDRDYRRDFALDGDDRSPRGDHWSPSRQRSSPLRRSPPPRRPSPSRRQHSGAVDRYRPQALSSSPARIRRDSDGSDLPRRPPLFPNLSWKASGMKSRQSSNVATSKSGSGFAGSPMVTEPIVGQGARESGPATRDFAGLTGVPTGPKQTKSSPPANAPRSLSLGVGIEVHSRPHIFISTLYVPAKAATVQHLHRLLKTCVPFAEDVHVDHFGYYVTFDDTIKGRERLDLCYKTYNRQMLFSEYRLNMMCHPNGNMSLGNSPQADRNGSARYGDTTEEQVPDSAVDVPEDPNLSVPESTAAEAQASGDSYPCIGDTSHRFSASASAAKPAQDSHLPLRRSPQLKISSRHDKDDSSSVSGFTSSDVSNSKRSKCHVCQSVSASPFDTLIQCSSCPRRYHSRCHSQPPIPTGPDAQITWQCRRCVKKCVQPESTLSNASLATDPDSAVPIGQSEESSTKKRAVGASSPVATPIRSIQVPPTASANDNTGFQDTIPNHVQATQASTDKSAHVHVLKTHPEKSDEAYFHEADDLVSKSFIVPSAADKGGTKNDGRGRLNLARRKVSRQDGDADGQSLSAADPLPTETMADHPSQDAAPKTQTDTLHVPKKKPHRWSGGGADRAIIEGGKAASLDWLPPPAQTSDKNSDRLATLSLGAANVAKKGAGMREVSQPRKEAIRAPDAARESPSAPVTHRMKPRVSSSSKCTNCKKTIAFNPSGTNKLCSRCKTEMSAEPPGSVNEVDEILGPLQFEPTAQELINADPNIAREKLERLKRILEEDVNARTDIGALAKKLFGGTLAPGVPSALQENQHSDIHNNDANHVNNAPNQGVHNEASDLLSSHHNSAKVSPQSERKDQHQTSVRTSCEECRLRHRRCTHTSPKSNKGFATFESPVRSPIGRRPVDDEEDDDDLDFWKPKATPDKSTTQTSANVLLKKPEMQNEPENNAPLLMEGVSAELDEDPDYPTTPNKTGSATRKRKSHPKAASGVEDLGDSHDRPKNTYLKLIGMALLDAPSRCLNVKEIVAWIAKNIEGYELREGNWESGVSATMSMNCLYYQNRPYGMWKKIDSRTEGHKKTAWRYELLPGKERELYHWDPVLQKPVSPPKGWHGRAVQEVDDGFSESASGGDPKHGSEKTREQHRPDSTNPASPVSSMRARREQRQEKMKKGRAKPMFPGLMTSDNRKQDENAEIADAQSDSDVEEMGSPMHEPEESSDEEPISMYKRRMSGATLGPIVSPELVDERVDDPMDVDAVGKAVAMAEPTPLLLPVTERHPGRNQSQDRSVLNVVLESAIQNRTQYADYSAKSLFNEWPEYDPGKQFDREAKISEIKTRPSKKQRFGMPSFDPWASSESAATVDASRISSLSLDRGNRTPNPTPRKGAFDTYPPENQESSVQRFETLEELFDLPHNTMAIVHDGQLAYRDGTRNEDGSLPRAKVIYKTGYA